MKSKKELKEVENFEIESIGVKDEWVYDLELEDNHNFFANNILVHNSIYCESTETNPFSVIKQGSDLENFLNEVLEQYNTKIAGVNHIFMEFEKALEKVLFVDAKKRYAYRYLWEVDNKFNVDKKVHATGFDLKRSDSSKLAKECQETVITMILNGEPKEKVVAYLKQKYRDMVSGELPIADVGFPKGIKSALESYNPPQAHIKAAIFSNEHFNTTFGENSKPKMVYIKSYNGSQPTVQACDKIYKVEAMVFDKKLPDGIEVDWEKMAKITYKKKLEKIFNAVNWGWTPLNTAGLDCFYSS